MNGDTTTIRFPAIAELEIDSFDRQTNATNPATAFFLNPTTSTNIYFQARQSLLSGQFNRISVSEFSLQWRTPNINPRNNTFAFEVSGNPTTFFVNLPTGFYDLSGIAQEMVQGMNTAYTPGGNPFSAIFNFNFSNDPNVASISILSSVPFRFALPTKPSDQKFQRTAGINSLNTGIYRSIQLISLTTDLAQTHQIDMVSNRLTKFSKVKDNTTRQTNGLNNILARIYLTPFNTKERFVGTYPQTMAVDQTTPKQIRWNPEEQINDFDLILQDEQGDELWSDPTIPDWNTEYQFTLQASES